MSRLIIIKMRVGYIQMSKRERERAREGGTEYETLFIFDSLWLLILDRKGNKM